MCEKRIGTIILDSHRIFTSTVNSTQQLNVGLLSTDHVHVHFREKLKEMETALAIWPRVGPCFRHVLFWG
jgi:hypothetical protein